MEFGEKIRQAREKLGMTQQTLADQLYVTRQAVSRWECGARYPDLLTAKCLSDILHVSVDDLLSGDELTRYAEKQPLLESARTEKIYFMLFSALTLLSGLYFMRYAFYLPFSAGDDGIIQLNLWKELITYGLFFAASLFGSVTLVKRDTTPGMVGFAGCCYFLIDAVKEGMNAFLFYLQSGFLPPILVLLSLCSAAAALMIWLYFAKGRNRMQWVIVCCCAASFLYRNFAFGYNVYMLVREHQLEMAYHSIQSQLLPLTMMTLVFALMFYQMRLLRRKRRLAA